MIPVNVQSIIPATVIIDIVLFVPESQHYLFQTWLLKLYVASEKLRLNSPRMRVGCCCIPLLLSCPKM